MNWDIPKAQVFISIRISIENGLENRMYNES